MKMLTAAEAAKVLGVSESWVRRHKHELPMVRMGGLLRFDGESLKELLAQRLLSKLPAGNLVKSERLPMEPVRFQQGSVYQKGNKRVWYGVYRQDINTPNGIKRKQRKVRLGMFVSKNAALNALAVEMGITPATDMTFQQLATRWKAAVASTYKTSTFEIYQQHLNAHLIPVFADRNIKTITPEQIQLFLNEQAKRYSKSTIRSMRLVLGLTLGCHQPMDRRDPCYPYQAAAENLRG